MSNRFFLNCALLRQLSLAILLCCLTFIAEAQTNEPITLNVTVTNDDRVPVKGLTLQDFSITVDKRAQKVLSFTDREEPMNVGILIDTSGSMYKYGPKALAALKTNLKQGLARFINLSHPDNQYFVLSFGDKTKVLQGWTTESGLVTSSLDSLEFKGYTPLYDVITAVIPKVRTGKNARHVLIVFSDGTDTDSKGSYEQVRELLKRSDVLFYGVGVAEFSERVSPRMEPDGGIILGEFAGYSGGVALFAHNFERAGAFDNAFEFIARELRSKYQIVISPEEAGDKERWRKISVSATPADASGKRKKLRVRTREGYYR